MGNDIARARTAQGALIAGTTHRNLLRRLAAWVRSDLHTTRLLPVALALLLIVSAITVMSYANHPVPETTHDTPSYTGAALRILAHGGLADPNRLPGYPLLIALVFALSGQGNLVAVSIVQGGLFVMATLEIYVLTYLATRRVWIAGITGLLVGTNVWLLAAVKFIMTEGIALWLTVTLALMIGIYIHTPRTRHLWLVAASLLALFMTRAEWMYLPIPLFAYLLFIAWRRGRLRPQIPHALAALALLYGVLGLFVLANAQQYGFRGVTDIQNVNLLGKVMQYHMEDEAPPQYARQAQIVSDYMARGVVNPYTIIYTQPQFERDHFALGGAYAAAIISRHPVEFLLDSIPFGLKSLPVAASGTYPHALIQPGNIFGGLLDILYRPSLDEFASHALFPLFALFWLVLLFRKRTSRLLVAELMGALSLVVLYGIVLATFGTYALDTAARVHTAFDPLLTIIISGSILYGVAAATRRFIPRHADSAPVATSAPESSVVR